MLAVDGVRYLNREDDAGDRGFVPRSSSTFLHACREVLLRCENELEDLREIPEIKTERLTLSVLRTKTARRTTSVSTMSATSGGVMTIARTGNGEI